MRYTKRPTSRDLGVWHVLWLTMLVLFSACIAFMVTKFSAQGGRRVAEDAGLLMLFAVFWGFSLRQILRPSPLGTSRKREVAGLAPTIPLAGLAVALHRLTGETWVIYVVMFFAAVFAAFWAIRSDSSSRK